MQGQGGMYSNPCVRRQAASPREGRKTEQAWPRRRTESDRADDYSRVGKPQRHPLQRAALE